MHPQRESQGQGPGIAGPEIPITPEQRERDLRRVDVDLEAMLLDVECEERELERVLDSVRSGAGS